MIKISNGLFQKCISTVLRSNKGNFATLTRRLRSDDARFRRKCLVVFGGGLAAMGIAGTNGIDDIAVGASGILRFIRSIRIGLVISLDYYFAMIGLTEGSENYDAMMSRIHQRCAERVKNGCLSNSGTYIKFGQGLVSLSHILPKEYIETLKILQDKCLTRDKEELYQVFRQDFGKNPEELFESFDTTPIAAASIAQVFKARTKEGRTVAVKVQYNDLEKRFSSDVSTMKILLKIGAFLHPKVDFTWILDDFVDTLRQELDFVNEGLNSVKCEKDLRHLKYVHIPEVLWKYTNKRVLVTEFVDGIKISDVECLKKNGFSLLDINNKLFEAFGHQIFQTGFVHADPHPGNVMVRKRNGQTELIILDHGLYQKVSDKERIALSHMWKAIVLGNHKSMKKNSEILGVDDYTMLAEILTQTPLRTMGFKLKVKLTEEEQKYMKKAAGERFDQIVSCLQQMPRSLLLVVRNLNTIRAITHDHGCPIDRYAVLARIATKGTFENDSSNKVKRVMASKLWFELALLINRVIRFWQMLFCDVLYKLGLAPDIRALMEQSAKL